MLLLKVIGISLLTINVFHTFFVETYPLAQLNNTRDSNTTRYIKKSIGGVEYWVKISFSTFEPNFKNTTTTSLPFTIESSAKSPNANSINRVKSPTRMLAIIIIIIAIIIITSIAMLSNYKYVVYGLCAATAMNMN